MNYMKMQLLGIGAILLGIAFATNSFYGYVGGLVGFVLVAVGAFRSEK